MPVVVPELADTVPRRQRRGQDLRHDRLAGGLDRSARIDVIAAATNLQSHATSNVRQRRPAGRAGRRRAATSTRWPRCASAFDRRRRNIAPHAHRDPRRHAASSPRAPSTPSRRSRTCSGASIGGRTADRPRSTWPRSCSARPRWRSCPARRSAAPGYVRLSFALGDDDLVEGVNRLAGAARRPLMARILVTEEIAEAGLGAAPRAPATRSTSSSGLTPEELLDAVRASTALIIRSATRSRPTCWRRAGTCVVVGRAGIGLDNVDVDAATRRGVMVVNAPQSNIVSAAEHTDGAAARPGPQHPPGPRRAHGRPVGAAQWEGVELYGKTLGVVGLGRIGELVAQRALAFGMRLIAYDPFVVRRAGQADGRRAGRRSRSSWPKPTSSPSTSPRRRRPSASSARTCWPGPSPSMRIINTARGGIVDEAALARAIRDGRHGGRGPRRLRRTSRPPSRRCSAGQRRRHPPPRRQHPRGAGQGRRHHRRAGAAGPGGRRSCPFAVNVSAAEASETVRPVPAARRAPRGASSPRWPRASPATLEVCVRGRARRLRHPHPDPVGPSRGCSAASATSRSRTSTRRQMAEEPASRSGRSARNVRAASTSTWSRIRGGGHADRRHPRRRRARAPHRHGRRPRRRDARRPAHARRPQRRPARHDRHGRHGARRRRASTSRTWTSVGPRPPDQP